MKTPFTCLLFSSKVPGLQIIRGPTKPELGSLMGFTAELYIQVRHGGSLAVGPTCFGTVQRYVKLCSGATETPFSNRPLKQRLAWLFPRSLYKLGSIFSPATFKLGFTSFMSLKYPASLKNDMGVFKAHRDLLSVPRKFPNTL